MYVNVGAKDLSGRKDFPSKAALKRAIQADPTNVYFYPTSDFTDKPGLQGTLDILEKGVKYSVVGPNPYKDRKWYATVEITPSGTIRVS